MEFVVEVGHGGGTSTDVVADVELPRTVLIPKRPIAGRATPTIGVSSGHR